MFRNREFWRHFLPQTLQMLGLVLVLSLSCIQGSAQATQGSIFGVVKDSAGAVVSGAQVTLTNTDEGATRVAKTNGVGGYQFVDVKAGHYNIEIIAPNFQKWLAKGVALPVRQQIRTRSLRPLPIWTYRICR